MRLLLVAASVVHTRHGRRCQQERGAHGAHDEAIRKKEVVATATRHTFGAQYANIKAECTHQLTHGKWPLEMQPGKQPDALRVVHDEHTH
jgi:hypothetical protein